RRSVSPPSRRKPWLCPWWRHGSAVSPRPSSMTEPVSWSPPRSGGDRAGGGAPDRERGPPQFAGSGGTPGRGAALRLAQERRRRRAAARRSPLRRAAGRGDMMHDPDVTIVVVPRERFSFARASLEALYRHTDPPFHLVYVDGGSPRRVRRYF